MIRNIIYIWHRLIAMHLSSCFCFRGKGTKSAQVVIIQEEPGENFIPGCNSLCAVSQAVCAAGASVKDVPLFEHIAGLVSSEVLYLYMYNTETSSIANYG